MALTGTSGILTSVSCPTSSFCAAVDNQGHASAWNGSSWSAAATADSGADMQAVSCQSASSCFAVSVTGSVVRFNGSSWSTPLSVDPGEVAESLSCPTTRFCSLWDIAGNELRFIDSASPSGPPVNSSLPAISGSLVSGQTLSAAAGTWSGASGALEHQWERCNASGGACASIAGATGTSLALTDADVGHTLRIDEWATNDAATGVVQGLPGPPGGGQPTGPGGGSTSFPLAKIKAGLLASIAPRGKGAHIAALSKRKGYSSTFRALVGGKVQIQWFFVPKGAHLSKAKPVLVASGRRSFSKAGGAKLTIKLTSKGRKLLKHAKRLKLTGKGTFSVAGGPKVSARKTFTLKR
jgi:hypothetical protein